jgi:hypothetical protein
VRNKFTKEWKQTILDALHNGNDEGLYGFVCGTAYDRPTAGMALLRRSSPSRYLARSITVEVILRRERSGRPLCAQSEPLAQGCANWSNRP